MSNQEDNISKKQFDDRIAELHDIHEKNSQTEEIIRENREIHARIYNKKLKLQETEINKVEKIQNSLENEDLAKRKWDREKLKKDIEDRKNAITFLNENISKHFVAAPGSLILIASMTNNGKSTLTAHIAETLVNEGKKVLILSNEEKESDVRARVSCLRLGISFGRHKTSKCSPEEELKILDDTDLLAEDGRLVVVSASTDEDAYMVTTVNGIMMALKKAKGVFDAVIIDYYTNVNMSELGTIEPWHVNNRLASELNIFKDTCPYPIIMMAQCEGIRSDKKNNDKAQLDYDANHPMYRWKGGQSILLYATDIIELIKDFDKDRSLLYGHKVRFSHGGLHRLHELPFDKKMQRFLKYTPEFDTENILKKSKRAAEQNKEEIELSNVFNSNKN